MIARPSWLGGKNKKSTDAQTEINDIKQLEDKLWPTSMPDYDRCRTSVKYDEHDDGGLGVCWLEALQLPQLKDQWVLIKITQYAYDPSQADEAAKRPSQTSDYYKTNAFSLRGMIEEMAKFESNQLSAYIADKDDEMDKTLKEYEDTTPIPHFQDAAKSIGIAFETDGTPHPTLRGCFIGSGRFAASEANALRLTEQQKEAPEQTTPEEPENVSATRWQDVMRTDAFDGVDFYDVLRQKPKIDSALSSMKYILEGLSSVYYTSGMKTDRFADFAAEEGLFSAYSSYQPGKYRSHVCQRIRTAERDINAIGLTGTLINGLDQLHTQISLFSCIIMLRDAQRQRNNQAEKQLSPYIDRLTKELSKTLKAPDTVKAWRIYLMAEDTDKLFTEMNKQVDIQIQKIKDLCDPFQNVGLSAPDMKRLTNMTQKAVPQLPKPAGK
jgi:hypothetical protein